LHIKRKQVNKTGGIYCPIERQLKLLERRVRMKMEKAIKTLREVTNRNYTLKCLGMINEK